MSNEPPVKVVIIVRRDELNPASRVWGTGGWQMPRDREGLDWLTLIIFMGWEPLLLYADDSLAASSCWHGAEVAVLALDPGQLSVGRRAELAHVVEQYGVTLIARAADPGSRWGQWAGAWSATPMEGRNISIRGEALAGQPREYPFLVSPPIWALEIDAESSVLLRLSNYALASRKNTGSGSVLTMGFHPSELRDGEGAGTLLIRDLLLSVTGRARARLDWSDTLILRMDDPGGAQNVHSKSWCYSKIRSTNWTEIGALLRARGARLTAGYIAGWVDDGDERRGRITVGGDSPRRTPGTVYPSRLVRHWDLGGHAPGRENNYQDEYEGLLNLVRKGLATVELHGYTHQSPDRESWLRAADQYENTAWFRELGAPAADYWRLHPDGPHPLAAGALEIEDAFGRRPEVLICPGEEFGQEALERALDLGIGLVGSYYLGIRWRDHLCWTQHVCAPYLDEPSDSWFDSGLPVVGYFHDKEIAEQGPEWLELQLKEWEACGARRFIDYATLLRSLNP